VTGFNRPLFLAPVFIRIYFKKCICKTLMGKVIPAFINICEEAKSP